MDFELAPYRLRAMEIRPGERVVFQGHPSWRGILSFYLKGLLLALLGGAVAALVTLIASGLSVGIAIAVAAAIVVLVVLVGLIKRVATTYTITNQRLHIRRGIVARKIQQTRIERVQNVNVAQSVLDRILQVGKVDFDTAGTDDADFSFAGVSQPEEVMQAVEQAQHEASQAGDASLGEPHPTTPPPPAATS